MSPRDRKRVARYHSRNIGCTPFDDARRFSPSVWRAHFERDLHHLRERATRSADPGEPEAIEAFLASEKP